MRFYPEDQMHSVLNWDTVTLFVNNVTNSKASFTLQAEPSRAEPGRASDYSHRKPSWPELKALQLTFMNCEDVKPSACIFINIWWRSLLFTRKRCFWVHTHFNPRKRNRIGHRLASKNKHQPGNTLGQARSGSVRFGMQCECFHFITYVCFPSRIGSVRLGWQCEGGLMKL